MSVAPPTKQQVYRNLAKRLDEHRWQVGLLAAEAMEDAAHALRDAADLLDKFGHAPAAGERDG